MKHEPLITVIVPIFNTAKYLPTCLESLSSQTETRFSVFLIDDCSIDASFDVARAHSKMDARFRVFRNERRQGVSWCRNAGIDNAISQFVFFLDSDDFLEPHAFQTVLDSAFQYSSDVVRGLHYWFYENEPEKTAINLFEEMNQIEVRGVTFAQVPNAVFCYTCWGTLIRRELLEKYEIRFDTLLGIGEDRLFNLNVFLHAKQLTMLKDHLYFWRRDREDSHASLVLSRNPYCMVQSAEKLVEFVNGNLNSGIYKTHRIWVHTAVFFELAHFCFLHYGSWRNVAEDLKTRLLWLLEGLDLRLELLKQPFIKGYRRELQQGYLDFYQLFYIKKDIDAAVSAIGTNL